MTVSTGVAGLLATMIALLAPSATGPEPEPRPRLHTELEESVPAEDTLITSALEDVVLIFSGPVEARLSSVRWVGPGGDTLSLEVSAVPDRPHVLVAEAPPAVNGAQRLVWRTVAADGHPVAGTIAYRADIPGAAEPAAADTGAAGPGGGDAAEEGQEAATADRMEDTGAAHLPTPTRIAVRGLGLFCLLGFAGLLWFGTGTTILDEPRTHRTASILGLGATVALTLDVLLWASELRAPGTGLSDTLSIALDTRTGAVEMGRVALAALGFLLFAGTRGVRVGAAVAMLAVVAGALGGHQATIQPLVSLPANGLHLGAAAVWTGGVLLLAVWPGRPREAEAGGAAPVGWTFPRVALRVSSAALLASGVILLTAVAQNLLYLPSPGMLFSSAYGNLVLAKAAGFAALVGFGAYHRFRLIPLLAGADGPKPASRLGRSVRFELLVLVVVVFVAAALAQIPPPME